MFHHLQSSPITTEKPTNNAQRNPLSSSTSHILNTGASYIQESNHLHFPYSISSLYHDRMAAEVIKVQPPIYKVFIITIRLFECREGDEDDHSNIRFKFKFLNTQEYCLLAGAYEAVINNIYLCKKAIFTLRYPSFFRVSFFEPNIAPSLSFSLACPVCYLLWFAGSWQKLTYHFQVVPLSSPWPTGPPLLQQRNRKRKVEA